MNYTVERIIRKVEKPFLYVDYNELLAPDIIMLSQTDSKKDYFGVPIKLHEGLEIVGYQEDEDISGCRDDIIMEGVCTLNETGSASHVKWVLKANKKGIRYVSQIEEEGW